MLTGFIRISLAVELWYNTEPAFQFGMGRLACSELKSY